MPGRFDTNEPDANPIDIARRYDIYVNETPTSVVVYHGAFFRGVRTLEKTGRFDIGAAFIEIELASGEVVFLRRHSVIKFCEAGGKITSKPDD